MRTYTVTISLYDYSIGDYPVHVASTRLPDIQAIDNEAARVLAENLYPIPDSLVDLSFRLEMQIGLIAS